MQPQLKFWRGYVILELKSKELEALLNLAAKQGLQLWNIRLKSQEVAVCAMMLQHFFLLRPLLRQTSSRVHVLKRYGFPFLMNKLIKRKFLVAGMVLFIAVLFILSSVVWQVKVEGNEKLKTADILAVAKQQGIYPLQWKFRLKNAEALSEQLHQKLPSVSWVGVQMHGTHLTIEIVESAQPEVKPLLSPRHLVASTNAVVTEIRAEKGRPMVKANAFVRKGDLLISGLIGNEQNQQIVVAKGIVIGNVWYTSMVEMPFELKRNTYTGATAKRFYLVFGNRALQLTGYRQKKFEHYNETNVRKFIQLGTWTAPIGWIKQTLLESQETQQILDLEQAKKIAIERAEASVLQGADNKARITAQKILHERVENGKVYMEVHFEVEQSIVQEQPIIQGE
jgi:similar to stage IV sporulation protein